VELWFWGMDDATAAECLPSGVAVTPSAAPRLPQLPDPERDGLDALLALAARHPGSLQLAPDALRLGWLSREYARWSRLAAAAVLALAVSVGGVLEWRIAQGATDVAALVARRSGLEAEEAALAADLGRRGLTLAELATVPEAAMALARGSADPASALVVVGTGFAAQSDVVVNGVGMRAAPLGEPPDMDPAGNGAAVREAAVVDDASADTGADGAESCLGAPEPGAAMLVEFGLAEGLDARRRDAALGWVRDAAGDLAPWRAGPAARTIGRRDAVVVSTDRDEAHSAVQWTICLRRGAGT
jgi:membrane protein YqaA with SNARE-associated domain